MTGLLSLRKASQWALRAADAFERGQIAEGLEFLHHSRVEAEWAARSGASHAPSQPGGG
jgi:hypothetical protein